MGTGLKRSGTAQGPKNYKAAPMLRMRAKPCHGEDEFVSSFVQRLSRPTAVRRRHDTIKVYYQNAQQNRPIFTEGSVKLEEFLAGLTGVRPVGNGWIAPCPAHDD